MPRKSRSTGVRAFTGFFLVLLVLGLSSSGTGRTAPVAGTAPADDHGKPEPGASSSAASSSASGDWMSRAQRRIADSEYEMSWQERPLVPALGPSWHAPNRAHGFRTYFTDDGLRLIPRLGEPPPWQFGLRLSGIGRADTLLPAARAVRTPAANRITYDRGDVVEWYVNDRRGLEQGFTLSAPPESDKKWPASDDAEAGAHDTDEPILLVFILEGDLSPIVSTDGQAIDFVTAAGARVLRYAELQVTDAIGTTLPARMEGWSGAGARGIRLSIDDRDAVWPLTVDPLLTSPSWTAESDQVSASFGRSAGTAGDVNGDGYSDVIVGALFYDNGQTDEGRVFVYHGSASGLSLTPNWTAESDQVFARFGLSVGTAGDVNGDGYSDVIVGADLFDNGQTDEGRAFVYHGSASGLSLTPDWTAESDQASARFGNSVSTAGDVNGDGYADVIAGAADFSNGQLAEGRAFVYHGSASGLSLTPTPNWTAEGEQTGARFGNSVSTAGDVNGDGYADVIVGASLLDNGQDDEGRAFVFHGSASGLSPTANWTAESDQENAQLGTFSRTAGDLNGDGYADVIVGARGFDNGQTDEGRAFVYHGSASGLSPTANWTAESDQASALFGIVGTAGDVNGDGYADVVVGASNFDLDPNTVVDPNNVVDSGRAFVYHGSASGLGPNGTPGNADWTANINQASAFFGFSVGTAGDVNGDGYAEVIVGAYGFDNGQADEGSAFVYLGSPSGPATTAGWTRDGNQAGANFGISVGTAGDVNGDGYADVIAGASQFDAGLPYPGAAFVYHGSASGLSLVPNWTAEGNSGGANFGISVGTAGDVNGDGYADVIVGAPGFDGSLLNEGGAFVYHGSASGLSFTPNWTAESDQESADFGVSVGTAGDINGDGYSDVIVGADLFDNGQTDEGRAFVFHGSASGLSLTPNWTAESDQLQDQFGFSVDTAGDINGDGYADAIVGAAFPGRAFVYHGSASGLSLTANWTGLGDGFGVSVGTAGDVNGDGYADVIVGFPDFLLEEGRAFVFHGSASGLSVTPNWTRSTFAPFDEFGVSVGTAGDVNGDGNADVIVGASSFNGGQTDEGRAFVYYGNGGAGLAVRPQQRRLDDTAPIAPLGASESPDSFRLAALGRTPFGRGLVKLEWEVKPLGTPLDGSGIQTGSAWLDTATTGVALNEIMPGLTPAVAYHWRLRLRYHPTTTPFQTRSRWLTVPWNGSQEADLRRRGLADPAVSQSEGADPILLGENVTYTVSITNSGPDGAPVQLNDTLPGGSVFVAATPSQGTCAPPAGGVVQCQLGIVASGGGGSVTVTVTPQAPGPNVNAAAVFVAGTDPNPSNNTTSETTTVLAPTVGNSVWLDTDRDGIQDAGEPGLANVLVALYDGAGFFLDAVVTDGTGAYGFPTLTFGASYRLRFIPPAGYVLTAKDQGADDLLDSDADPVTQLTPVITVVNLQDQDMFRWDAGFVLSCEPPDEPIFISGTGVGPANEIILTFQDFNQPTQVTGYNVYRSSNASLPPASWPRVASNIVDGDEATPNNQWADTSGDPPPGGIWFYNVTAWNSVCNAEGPF